MYIFREVIDGLKSKPPSKDDSSISISTSTSLLKSHSHESQLTYNNNHSSVSYNDVQPFNNQLKMCGTRLKTEPDLDTNRDNCIDVVDSNHSRGKFNFHLISKLSTKMPMDCIFIVLLGVERVCLYFF